VLSIIFGADPYLICYQAPIGFKVNEREKYIDGCGVKKLAVFHSAATILFSL